jgi:hypothetical protein
MKSVWKTRSSARESSDYRTAGQTKRHLLRDLAEDLPARQDHSRQAPTLAVALVAKRVKVRGDLVAGLDDVRLPAEAPCRAHAHALEAPLLDAAGGVRYQDLHEDVGVRPLKFLHRSHDGDVLRVVERRE